MLEGDFESQEKKEVCSLDIETNFQIKCSAIKEKVALVVFVEQGSEEIHDT